MVQSTDVQAATDIFKQLPLAYKLLMAILGSLVFLVMTEKAVNRQTVEKLIKYFTQIFLKLCALVIAMDYIIQPIVMHLLGK